MELRDAQDKVMVALDCRSDQALALATALEGHARWMKVGITLIYDEGPAFVMALKRRGYKVFLDAKFHDIPFQVERAVKSASFSGADLITVHGAGSAQMLRACRRGADEAADVMGKRPLLAAITVLTSMNEEELARVGVTRPIAEQALALARLAHDSGIDGVVCSPQEAASMRSLLGPDALVVTPGVRPRGAARGDQSRVATPAEAVRAGASHIVVGRPITCADDPLAAFDAIVGELVDDVA
ncbi:orotidine-5'-phosphate decarboxylase [Coriobacterium glomerans PW2]|uniref:Orotidine 5'-phosphate decarboxylase n=1 Tax=Coriobacterium glomerans (strain ATCC 49209 / DSM 20642 / JCM 10262 / PW2) TaxID=700015 RepID=F2N9M9_CORGP|nr:orotidine-5'-phosphate decarboxylase [Coriobacterium glomerans]AEB07132.1 orotidine-5'-phosphate decarboxylase [Coriobacterium glomerans PW2]